MTRRRQGAVAGEVQSPHRPRLALNPRRIGTGDMSSPLIDWSGRVNPNVRPDFVAISGATGRQSSSRDSEVSGTMTPGWESATERGS